MYPSEAHAEATDRTRSSFEAVSDRIARSSTVANGSDTYRVDGEHTYPSIELSHLGISVWRGKFNRTNGKILLDRKARTGTVDIVVDSASIDFGLDAMDAKTKSADFLDVEIYPTIVFRGTLTFAGDAPNTVEGAITIRAITKPLTLTIVNSKCILDRVHKREVCGAEVDGELDWSQFGMRPSKYGGSNRVALRVQVEGVKSN